MSVSFEVKNSAKWVVFYSIKLHPAVSIHKSSIVDGTEKTHPYWGQVNLKNKTVVNTPTSLFFNNLNKVIWNYKYDKQNRTSRKPNRWLTGIA